MVWRRNLIVDFWEVGGLSRLLCVRTVQYCQTDAPQIHPMCLSNHQMWAISRLLDCVVTFLCDCSRRGGRGWHMTRRRKSIFASFRSERLRLKALQLRSTYREDMVSWTWWLRTIMVVVWGLESCAVRLGWENGTVRQRWLWVVFPGTFSESLPRFHHSLSSNRRTEPMSSQSCGCHKTEKRYRTCPITPILPA